MLVIHAENMRQETKRTEVNPWYRGFMIIPPGRALQVTIMKVIIRNLLKYKPDLIVGMCRFEKQTYVIDEVQFVLVLNMGKPPEKKLN